MKSKQTREMGSKREAFISRLENLCRRKTEAGKQEAERQALEQTVRLPLASAMGSHGELAELIDLTTRGFYRNAGGCYENDCDINLNALGDDLFWPQFTQVLQLQRKFMYMSFHAKANPDPSAPDEANIETSLASVSGDECGIIESIRNPLLKLLLALGHFARKANAIAYPKIVELLAIRRRCDFLFHPMTAEEAGHFTETLRDAVASLSAERELCTREELDRFLDEPPNPAIDDDYEDTLPFICDCDNPEDATEQSKQMCLAAYERQVKPLREPTLTVAGTRLPLEILRDQTKKLADELERGKITTDDVADCYRYEILNDLLKLETNPVYCKYHWDPEKANRPEPFMRMSEELVWVERPENAIKEEILADLDRFVDSGMKIALRIKSKSLDAWQRCALILKDRVALAVHGNFRSKREIDAKLAELRSSLQRARTQLWADIRANGGKLRLGKTPGRPAASLGKGPQTSGKAKQRKAVCRKIRQTAGGFAEAKRDSDFIKKLWPSVMNEPGGYSTMDSLKRWFNGLTFDKFQQYK